MVDMIHAVNMDDKIWTDFKQFVIGKHGKLHGVLGIEISKALEGYITSRGYYMEKYRRGPDRTHTHTDSDDGLDSMLFASKVSHKSKFEAVKDSYYAKAGDCDTFQRPYAERLIKENMGVYDSRTVEKYCRELQTDWELRI